MNLNKKYHIALFQKHLKGLSTNGGGIERVQINLSKAFIDSGHKVDLITCDSKPLNLGKLSEEINIIKLRPSLKIISSFYLLSANPSHQYLKPKTALFSKLRPRTLRYLPGFVSYLTKNQPDIVFSAFTDINLVALLAFRVAKVSTKIIVSEHEPWTEQFMDKANNRKRNWYFPPSELSKLYSEAQGIIAVSHGCAEGLASAINLEKNKISTIYNPIISADLFDLAQKEVVHKWIKQKDCPVILGVGRLSYEKNFSLLIKALALVKKHRPSKLIILGNGKEFSKLQLLVKEYNLSDDVDFPGFVDNPYAFMAQADLFVLSSFMETLSNVLVEALACGCPVVSTDCPSGPAEILEHGKYGPLVPVNDEKALAEAIISVLNDPPDSNWLQKRGLDFTTEKAAKAYLELAECKK